MSVFRHYHRLLHSYWLDHRHRHLHQHHVKPLQHSLFYCYWWATSSSYSIISVAANHHYHRLRFLSLTIFFIFLIDGFRQCHWWASTSSPPACLRPWCLRFHGWLIMPLLMGVFVFFTGHLVCYRLIISLPWLHNSVVGRFHLQCWLTWLLPTGFFASTAVQLHHFWLVSLSSLPPIFLPPLVGNIIFILVVLSLCQLHQLPSMDNCDYYRRTSYMLKGLLAQTQVAYLQFGLVPDTCNMNSWSWVNFLCSTTGLFIIPHEGHQLSICTSRDLIIIST